VVGQESLSAYYTNNFNIGISGTNKYTLEDLESMLPFERTIYLSLLENHLREKSEEMAKQNGGIKTMYPE
jgi:hypothetical protein